MTDGNLSANLLAVDPGLRGVGLAVFESRVLTYANYIENPVAEGGGPKAWFALGDAVFADLKTRRLRIDVYVTEYPQVYRQSRGDPNDLIEITGVAAACGASLPIQACYGYLPRQWKGQLKKEVHHPLILAKLTETERAAILETRKTYIHNVIDAVGIGLHALKR